MEDNKVYRQLEFRSPKDIKKTKCPICPDLMGDHSDKNKLRHWDYVNTAAIRLIQENNAMREYIEKNPQKEPVTVPTPEPIPETTPVEADMEKVV